MRNRVSYARLREVLAYQPDTGNFYWLETLSNRAVAGTRAGCTDSRGYLRLGLDGFTYPGHCLAWFYMTKKWPVPECDHKDVNPSNNKWSNLRQASLSQNRGNARIRSNNTTGFKGVRLHWTGRYEAYLTMRGKQKYLGGFDNPVEAHAAYMVAAKKYFGEFARSS